MEATWTNAASLPLTKGLLLSDHSKAWAGSETQPVHTEPSCQLGEASLHLPKKLS